MTGSARNSSSASIQAGMPIAEDEHGNAVPPSNSSTAFAVATQGTAPGGIVQYATEGLVKRTDWSSVLGSKFLTPGQAYYVGVGGMISTSGQQQIGVAQSATALRISIGQSIAPVAAIHTVGSPPEPSFGKIGDYAINPFTLQLFGPKRSTGWQM